MDNYQDINDKYLKYKKKYLALKKNQIGGNDENNPKVTKTESGYINAYPDIRCGTCKFFEKETKKIIDVEEVAGLRKVSGYFGECHLVKGDIHEYGCCNLWTAPGKKLHLDFSGGDEIKEKLNK